MFHVCRALQELGVETHIFTNYPMRLLEQFGVDASRAFGFVPHGVVVRLLELMVGTNERTEAFAHEWFGRQAASALSAENWDAVYAMSGVAEECFDALRERPTVKVLARGSSHVRTQARILAEEEHRAGRPVERPSAWRIAREIREYAKADVIETLSTFAYQTFLDEDVPSEKVWMNPLGVDVERFRSSPSALKARTSRVLRGDPLRILTVGTLSLRKGLLDHLEVVRRLSSKMKFRFVGSVDHGVADLVRRRPEFEIRPRVPEHDLPNEYAWADAFYFPSIEDGFAAVLAQARASCLPILSTSNCSAPDLLEDRVTGALIPIRDPEAAATCLEGWDKRRDVLHGLMSRTAELPKLRGWPDEAEDLVLKIEQILVDCHAKGAAEIKR